ncbi:Phytocyanin domain [Dillenia turbinata]|uniref:Phytocyanin domain n=1 Tax=Dillenia turbinata TaxID=194707 RepID=A0AAN8YWG0_9MAGN
MGSFWFLFCTCMIILAAPNAPVEASREFKVGDHEGWREPRKNNSALYDQWATRNRFQIGDSLYFEYVDDSVLQVQKWGYYHCDTTNPIIIFNNGNSVINLDRSGPFYFISGNPGHCKNGQRLIVEVMGLHLHPIHQSPPSVGIPPEPYSAISPSPSQLSTPSSGSFVLVTGISALIVVLVSFVTLVLV